MTTKEYDALLKELSERLKENEKRLDDVINDFSLALVDRDDPLDGLTIELENISHELMSMYVSINHFYDQEV